MPSSKAKRRNASNKSLAVITAPNVIEKPDKPKPKDAASPSPPPVDSTPEASVAPPQAERDVLRATAREVWHLITDTLYETVHFLRVLLRKPLALAIIVYLLLMTVSYTLPLLIHTVLDPICSRPILNRLPVCAMVRTTPRAVPEPNYPKLVELQANIGNILESNTGTSLALDMRNSETAVRDLTVVVRTSDLVAKEELTRKLEEFISDAKDAAGSLQRLGSRVGGAVDNILTVDEFVLRELQRLNPPALPSSPPSKNLLLDPLSVVSYLIPFSPFAGAKQKALKRQRHQLVTSFLTVATQMEKQLHQLHIEAEASLMFLRRMDNTLDTLHEMIEREKIVVGKGKDELLAQLWTHLGGNRAALESFSSHTTLLAQMSIYRSQALLRISSTILQITQLSADLEDLRDRVANPVLTMSSGYGGDEYEEGGIPLEVHVESIRKGIERLGEFRKRGVERENEQLRKMLNGGATSSRLVLEERKGPASRGF